MAQSETPILDLDPSTTERLRKIADERGSAPHALMKQAVEQYVDREERRSSVHADAAKAWAAFQADGLYLTGEEADEWLDRLAAGEDADLPACHG